MTFYMYVACYLSKGSYKHMTLPSTDSGRLSRSALSALTGSTSPGPPVFYITPSWILFAGDAWGLNLGPPAGEADAPLLSHSSSLSSTVCQPAVLLALTTCSFPRSKAEVFPSLTNWVLFTELLFFFNPTPSSKNPVRWLG